MVPGGRRVMYGEVGGGMVVVMGAAVVTEAVVVVVVVVVKKGTEEMPVSREQWKLAKEKNARKEFLVQDP